MSGLIVVSGPAIEPVTLRQAKDHLRVDSEIEDGTISALISAARSWCEAYTGRAFIDTTYDWSIDTFAGVLVVPRSPLRSVESITYIDDGGVAQILDPSSYRADTYSGPARITLAYQQAWPSVLPVAGAVTVRFVAGYGPGEDDVPAHVRQAVLMLTAELFENRQQSSPQTVNNVPFTVRALLDPERILTI
jgi:uncharacterized phiE125 gp8 family phage protein